jgi:hypothetical protein
MAGDLQHLKTHWRSGAAILLSGERLVVALNRQDFDEWLDDEVRAILCVMQPLMIIGSAVDNHHSPVTVNFSQVLATAGQTAAASGAPGVPLRTVTAIDLDRCLNALAEKYGGKLSRDEVRDEGPPWLTADGIRPEVGLLAALQKRFGMRQHKSKHRRRGERR